MGSIHLFGIEADDAFAAIDDEGGEPACAAGLPASPRSGARGVVGRHRTVELKEPDAQPSDPQTRTVDTEGLR